MSETKLREIVKSIVDGAAIEKILNASSKASTFRDTLNRKLHIVTINENILSTVSEEAISILTRNAGNIAETIKNSGKGLGINGNASAVQLILAQYRKLKNITAKTESFTLDGQKTYKLVFNNYNDVRDFFNTIGFYSAPLAAKEILLNRLSKEEVDLVESIFGKSIYDMLGSIKNPTGYPKLITENIYSSNKELGIKLKYLLDKISFDVGHNSPVQYEALDIIANDKDMLLDVLSTYMSDIYATERSYKNKELAGNTKHPKYHTKLIKSTSLTASSIDEDNIAKLMKDISNNLHKNLLELELVTHKKIHMSNDSVSGEFVFVFPEATKDNIGKLENKLTTMMVQKIGAYLVKNKVIHQDLIKSKSSPSIIDKISEKIISEISGIKSTSKDVKSSTKTSIKAKLPKPDSVKVTSVKQVIKTKPKPTASLRNLQGQFTSLTSLQNLLNMQLHDQIKKNMHRPNLKYQTGRFAESVKVEQLSRARDGAITAFMSYMRYPYATFEVGGKQGHKGYYPSRLINTSVRELAAKLVKEKFTSITIK